MFWITVDIVFFSVSYRMEITQKKNKPYLEKSMGTNVSGFRLLPYDNWFLLNLPILR